MRHDCRLLKWLVILFFFAPLLCARLCVHPKKADAKRVPDEKAAAVVERVADKKAKEKKATEEALQQV